MQAALQPEVFRKLYNDFAGQNPKWNEIPSSTGNVYEWDRKSTYIQEPPFFDELFDDSPAASRRSKARARSAIFGDSVTTDHISPAGAIKKTSPAGKYLIENGVTFEDFNSYGSRRGNDRVMTRGTFANVRIKNLMVPGVEGGVTKFQPDGEAIEHLRRRHEISGGEHAARHSRRTGIRHRLFARLGRERHEPARRESRRRAELRAHPSQQPRRHGRAAVAVQGRHDRADA